MSSPTYKRGRSPTYKRGREGRATIAELAELGEVDVTNHCRVGSVDGGKNVTILIMPPPDLPRDQALLLAAWLVAVADGADEFAEWLEAVGERV